MVQTGYIIKSYAVLATISIYNRPSKRASVRNLPMNVASPYFITFSESGSRHLMKFQSLSSRHNTLGVKDLGTIIRGWRNSSVYDGQNTITNNVKRIQGHLKVFRVESITKRNLITINAMHENFVMGLVTNLSIVFSPFVKFGSKLTGMAFPCGWR